MLDEFKDYKGKIEEQQTIKEQNGITIHNYLLSSKLEKEINQSKIIVCRSGYSSIMDLATLGKKVFFIPTQNQPEQEYLAKYLSEGKQAPFATEQDFVIQKLQELENHKGLRVDKNIFDIDIPIDFFREMVESKRN